MQQWDRIENPERDPHKYTRCRTGDYHLGVEQVIIIWV